MTDSVYSVRLAHLPPMTGPQFAAYMAAEQACIAAERAAHDLAVLTGGAAYAAGVPYEAYPADSTNQMHRQAWQQGWSEAQDINAPVNFDGSPLPNA